MNKVSESVADDQGSMVLRTVYLPAQLDEQLKKLAFHGSTSKGALIRKALYNLVADQDAIKAPDHLPPEAEVR